MCPPNGSNTNYHVKNCGKPFDLIQKNQIVTNIYSSIVLSADKLPAKYSYPCQKIWYFGVISYLQPFSVHEIAMFCHF